VGLASAGCEGCWGNAVQTNSSELTGCLKRQFEATEVRGLAGLRTEVLVLCGRDVRCRSLSIVCGPSKLP
jgi:hypothetical protein